MSFDLDSLGSSDESSVVDVAALLSVDKRNVRNKSPEIDTHLHADPPCDVEDNESARHHPKAEVEWDDGDYHDDDGDTNGMVRIVMGESVKAYRREKRGSSMKEGGLREEGVGGGMSGNKYMLVRQNDSTPNPSIAIDFPGSRLKLRQASQQVDVIRDESTDTYSAKIKRQLVDDPNSRQSSSAFVDCVAIWDADRRVYVLEIPGLVVTDFVKATGGDGGGAVGSKSNEAEIRSDADLLKRRDPLQQQRQAERKVQKRRRRKI